jgi:hypothetical protein
VDNNNKCVVCNCVVNAERVEFLIENGNEITCVNHSITAPIKALYSGQHGASDLIFCRKVCNDSVRSAFYDSETLSVDTLDDYVDDEEEEDL